MYTILLLIEQRLNHADVAQVTGLHEGGEPERFVVLVPSPVEQHRLMAALDELVLGRIRDAADEIGEPEPAGQEADRQARSILDASVNALRAGGVEAIGEVVPGDPVRSLRAVADRENADEVIVLTRPHLLEQTLGRDWAARARHALGLPVLRLFAHAE